MSLTIQHEAYSEVAKELLITEDFLMNLIPHVSGDVQKRIRNRIDGIVVRKQKVEQILGGIL